MRSTREPDLFGVSQGHTSGGGKLGSDENRRRVSELIWSGAGDWVTWGAPGLDGLTSFTYSRVSRSSRVSQTGIVRGSGAGSDGAVGGAGWDAGGGTRGLGAWRQGDHWHMTDLAVALEADVRGWM